MLAGDAINEKKDAEHFEDDPKHAHDVVLKSNHDNLGIWATAWKFKKVSISLGSWVVVHLY